MEVYLAMPENESCDAAAFSTLEKAREYMATFAAETRFYVSKVEVDKPGYGEDWTETVPLYEKVTRRRRSKQNEHSTTK